MLRMETPKQAQLEQAIRNHLNVPAGAAASGALYVKVGELERVKWPPDSEQFRGGLFLSVPFLGADRTKLEQAFAQVNKGFKDEEILPDWHIEASKDKPFHHRDKEADAVLLTLPVVLTLERRRNV